jgi:hypothetical protein
MGLNRILIQHSDGRRIPVEPAEIFYLEGIAEIRTRRKGEGWELKMEPPVNRIIPIGETYEARLWKAFE